VLRSQEELTYQGAKVDQKRHFEVVTVEHKVDVEEEEVEEEAVEEAVVVAVEGSAFRSWPERVTTFQLSRQRGAL
jgi:hypothetical protein